jgi:hypothetical protein
MYFSLTHDIRRQTMNLKIRLRGLVFCILGLGLATALVALVPVLVSAYEFKTRGMPKAILTGALGGAVWGLIGLIELISGCRFYKIAQQWDSSPRLVRFGLGLVLIAVFFVGFRWCITTYFLQG